MGTLLIWIPVIPAFHSLPARRRVFRGIIGCLAVGSIACKAGFAAEEIPAAAAVSIGERLFSDVRFAQPFATHGARARENVSCRSCHRATATLAFADDAPRSAILLRDDQRTATTRNSPSLVDALTP